MITKPLICALPLLVGGWIAILAGVTLLTDDAPAHLVLFPNKPFLATLPPDMAVLQTTGWSITLQSQTPKVAERLYETGAWLVLPAGLFGCFTDRSLS